MRPFFSRFRLRRSLQIAGICLVTTLFLGAGDDARFNLLGHKLMCVCGCNQILLECNHVGCQYSERMRGELIAGMQKSESDDLTLQGFVQTYGPTVLAAPTTTGFNRVAWIMPFAALLAGISLTVGIVRKWNLRPAPAGSAPPAPASPELDSFRQRARKETEY